MGSMGMDLLKGQKLNGRQQRDMLSWREPAALRAYGRPSFDTTKAA